jgi:uncharacterized protein YndB with AHSA1/START domain
MAETSTNKLTVELPSDLEIVMSRTFDAPRSLVFEAHSKAEHVRRWYGPKGSTMTVCDLDFRPGGSYRYVLREKDGQEYGFRGEFREIVPAERIVVTFEFEGMPGHVSVESMRFEERDGKTTITSTSRFDSKEDRDGMLQSGMEEGAAETYDRLAELVRQLA